MSIRVLVVDDSLAVRKHLVAALEADPSFEVVGEAASGAEAIASCLALRPDVMTLDMVMPDMSGADVTRRLMVECPTPILVVSASFNRGEMFKTYDALAAGAVDVLEKPRGTEPPGSWETTFKATLRLVARIRVIRHIRPVSGPLPTTGYDAPAEPRELVAIGASAGGPGAVRAILRALPASFPWPLLIVIHVAEPFGNMLADWLAGETDLPLRTARSGEGLPPAGKPQVLLAPAGRHLEVAGSHLRLTDGPERHSCKPAVDVLFESLARQHGPRVVGVVLSGMGRDGAQGLLALRRAGAMTIAQDEATSVVFGMPREAIRLDAARMILPLQDIAPTLVRLAGGQQP